MGTRILAVEDDERIRAAVKLALEDEGWTVAEAATGEDALTHFTQEPADVVLIDIMLPGIDGFEVCRSIRRTTPSSGTISRSPKRRCGELTSEVRARRSRARIRADSSFGAKGLVR